MTFARALGALCMAIAPLLNAKAAWLLNSDGFVNAAPCQVAINRLQRDNDRCFFACALFRIQFLRE